MCGRFQFNGDDSLEISVLISKVYDKYNIRELPAGEIFPSFTIPVMLEKDGLGLMKWGFPKPGGGSGLYINARSETASVKPMFSQALRRRRCVVPSTGFFEWTKKEAGKEKYLFRLPGLNELYMAGLYGDFRSEDGSVSQACIILTTAANEYMAPYHDRMPVVLEKSDASVWLEGNYRGILERKQTPALEAKKAV